MARTLAAARWLPATGPHPVAEAAARAASRNLELHRSLPPLIVSRAIIVFAGLNLAGPLGLLPGALGSAPFLPLFNVMTVLCMLVYVALWWSGRIPVIQLYAQIGVDLTATTVLVANTRGMESPFVSFYILIVIYSSVLLGKSGGMIVAALSTTLHACFILADHLGLPGLASAELEKTAFRLSAHSVAFFAVAFLGTYLSQRVRAMQQELQEKVSSLEQLQRLNENIVGSIRSGLITMDLEGRIALFNNTAEELTGRKKEETLGKPVQAMIGSELWERILRNDFFRDARPLRYEGWVTPDAGARRFLGFSVSPLLDRAHQLLGYIISFQDLTEIKRLEEEVRRKDRMAAIGRMAAGMAHEIRNPLTSMRGSVEILRSRVNLPRTDERLLDILIRESDRLNNFVEDFLQLARPGKYAKAPVELVSLLRDSVSLLENNPEVREKHEVRLRLKATQIQTVGNADQLRQVFWNLSHNAIRAMPDGGTLTISARQLPDGGARIIFEDAGVGMSPEEQEQLFQPFQAGFKGGTGLGLSIVFQIMEDHNGRISFESEKGRGTKVVLSLPPQNQVVASGCTQ